MREELDAKLVKDFPNLYKDRYADMRETCMCWGFDHLDGWYDIIRQLSIKLEPIAKKTGMKAVQCKEKYGSLRFYVSGISYEAKGIWGLLCRIRWVRDWFYNKVYEAIDEAEKKSETTCEECGKEGKLHGKSWYFTRCNECWEKICEEKGYNDDEGELP